ncbi:tetratricopeptide repeat protein [Planctomycetota bacterium]
MNDESKDIKAIFTDALEKETSKERAEYLDKVCGNDIELREKVEALLKAYNEADDVPEGPIIKADITLDDGPLVEGPGTVIDRYKLLEKIGEGGMASVYMAEQKEPVRRKVALKIIKLGMDTKQVITRFEVERQALAMMDHPHIAKVYDAGKTKTGRPYFVMELVKGVPITEYCDKNELDTRARLDLFMSVCQAIQHAHQKGIIHRDIKPTNVLVTLHDGKPVPKVIDFGIAKATNQELTQKTLFTRFAQMIGTPEYMSPEQAEMTGLDVDTRTDIYSLGVLLYELLIGITPLDAKSLYRAGYAEIQRMIREEEPTKPSTRISTLGEELTTIAKHRHTSPDSLRKQIAGDLDWVVMKSLEKDRTRRYASATEFAADIQRHINHEPVLAAAPSLTYKIGKFVRRNRSLVTAAAVVFIVLVAGIISSMTFAIWALDERKAAELAKEEEARQRQIAEQSLKNNTALLNILLPGYIDSMTVMPFTYSGREELEYLSLSIPDMLQQSLSFLPGLRVSPFESTYESVWYHYGKEPQDPILIGKEFNVKAVVAGSIAAQGDQITIQIKVVETEKGYEIFSPVFTEKRANLTQIPTNIAESIAKYLQVQLTAEEAQRAFKVTTNEPEAFKNYMMGRSFYTKMTSKGITSAIEYYEEAIKIDPGFAKAYAGLADVYLTRGRQDGEPAYIWRSRAREAAEKALALDKDLADAYISIGRLFQLAGKYEQAKIEFERAIYLNPSNKHVYDWLPQNYKHINNLKMALEIYDKEYYGIPTTQNAYYTILSGQIEKGIKEVLLSVDRFSGRPFAIGSAGQLLVLAGEHEQGIEWTEKCLDLDPNDYTSIYCAVWVYHDAGQFDKAIQQARKMIELYPKSYFGFSQLAINLRAAYDNDRVIEEFEALTDLYLQAPFAYINLGIAYRNAERYDEAIIKHQEAIKLAPYEPEAYDSLGLTYQAAGKYEQAEESFLKAVEYGAYTAPITYMTHLTDLYVLQGKYDEAVKYYENHIEDDPNWVRLRHNLGKLYRDNYEYEKALEVLREAVDRFPDDVLIRHEYCITLSYIGDHSAAIEQYEIVLELIPWSWNRYESMALLYLQARDFDSAIEYFIQAVEIEPKGAVGLAFNEIIPIWYLSDAYLANKQYKEAAESYRKTFNLGKIPNADQIFDNAFTTGQYNQLTLQNYLKNILEAADKTNNPFLPRQKARYYAFFGEKEKCLEMLDEALEAKDPQLSRDVWLLWFDELYSEPGFQEIIKKLKLDKYFYQ